MMTVKKGDLVRVKRCKGIARVRRVSRVDGVVFLDQRMHVRFPGKDGSADAFVPFWTFDADVLTVVDIGVNHEEK